MNLKFLGVICALIFLFSGCATSGGSAKDKNIKTYTGILDSDGASQLITVEDKSDTGAGTIITVSARDKAKTVIDTLTLPSKVTKFELVDLDKKGINQLAIYSKSENNATHFLLYRLNNNQLTKMFDATSEFGIASQFEGTIPRVKIGKSRAMQQKNSPNFVNDWDTWVWTGEKFIKEQ